MTDSSITTKINEAISLNEKRLGDNLAERERLEGPEAAARADVSLYPTDEATARLADIVGRKNFLADEHAELLSTISGLRAKLTEAEAQLASEATQRALEDVTRHAVLGAEVLHKIDATVDKLGALLSEGAEHFNLAARAWPISGDYRPHEYGRTGGGLSHMSQLQLEMYTWARLVATSKGILAYHEVPRPSPMCLTGEAFLQFAAREIDARYEPGRPLLAQLRARHLAGLLLNVVGRPDLAGQVQAAIDGKHPATPDEPVSTTPTTEAPTSPKSPTPATSAARKKAA
jgi:hypothetical protein